MSIWKGLVGGSKNEDGAVLVVVTVMMVLLIGFVALAIDVGYAFVAKNELQNAADASALAAARELGSIYQSMSYVEQQAYVCDPNDIIPVAQSTAASNKAATQSAVVLPEDVVIGTWDYTTKTLTPTLEQPDAVQVTTRRDDEAHGGPVSTFFARIFNVRFYSVRTNATAALTGQSTAEPGELELPVGVSVSRFSGEPESWCGQVIKFSPTTDPDACAGWTTFESSPANDNKVRDILEGTLGNGDVVVGDTEFQFTNGDLSEGTFERLMSQYQNNGHDVDGIYDPVSGVEPGPATAAVPLCMNSINAIVECGTDGTTLDDQLHYPPCSGAGGCSGDLRYAHEWETTVVVYDSNDCSPGKDMPLAGFAQVVVYNVGMPSNKVVAARIRCDFVDPEGTRGGGGNFGKKGSIPGLVE